MSNESSGLVFNGDIINNVLKPEFEFKGLHNLNGDNSDAHITINKDSNDYEKEIIDERDGNPPVIQSSIDEDPNSMQAPNKGIPLVIQQRYGASTCVYH